jgi:hypothetical protein
MPEYCLCTSITFELIRKRRFWKSFWKVTCLQWSKTAPDNPHFNYVLIHGISSNIFLHRKITVTGFYVQMMEVHLTVGTKVYNEFLHKLCLQHHLVIEQLKLITYGIWRELQLRPYYEKFAHYKDFHLPKCLTVCHTPYYFSLTYCNDFVSYAEM